MGRQRKRKGDPVHGWLAVDKPVDISSTKVVGILKRLYNAQKAGHGGTLDPLADGILPIAFGEATKTAQWAMDCDKEYVFTIEWGSSTASQDKEGEVIATSSSRGQIQRYGCCTPVADVRGDIEPLSMWAGQSSGLVKRVQPAAEIVEEIMVQAKGVVSGLQI